MAGWSPTALDLGRTRDLEGRSGHVWFRRAVLALMAAFIVAALLGAFGQEPSVRSAQSRDLALRVKMPEATRGGLLWPARIELRAKRAIAAPTIVLGSGFVEGQQLNTIEPAPTSETTRPSRGGKPASLAFTYPSLDAGDTLTLYLQLQTNPTTVGSQDVSVSVEGAGAAPVRSPASLRVLP